MLLFADEMVTIGHSTLDIQHNLNRLHDYCNLWGVEVNIAQNKVVVFRKRGPVRTDERWYYNNELLDVVNEFNYLGVVFNFTGSFVLNNQCIIGKGLKAMHVLLQYIKRPEVNPKLSLQLFDVYVGSILNYGCPICFFRHRTTTP